MRVISVPSGGVHQTAGAYLGLVGGGILDAWSGVNHRVLDPASVVPERWGWWPKYGFLLTTSSIGK